MKNVTGVTNVITIINYTLSILLRVRSFDPIPEKENFPDFSGKLRISQSQQITFSGFRKKLARNIIFLDFASFSAPRSRNLGRYSKFSGMRIPSQSNGFSKFSQEFFFRKSKRTHPKSNDILLFS